MKQDLKDLKRAIPRDLWLKARSQAVLEGKTMAQWLIGAIEDKLKREGAKTNA